MSFLSCTDKKFSTLEFYEEQATVLQFDIKGRSFVYKGPVYISHGYTNGEGDPTFANGETVKEYIDRRFDNGLGSKPLLVIICNPERGKLYFMKS